MSLLSGVKLHDQSQLPCGRKSTPNSSSDHHQTFTHIGTRQCGWSVSDTTTDSDGAGFEAPTLWLSENPLYLLTLNLAVVGFIFYFFIPVILSRTFCWSLWSANTLPIFRCKSMRVRSGGGSYIPQASQRSSVIPAAETGSELKSLSWPLDLHR